MYIVTRGYSERIRLPDIHWLRFFGVAWFGVRSVDLLGKKTRQRKEGEVGACPPFGSCGGPSPTGLSPAIQRTSLRNQIPKLKAVGGAYVYVFTYVYVYVDTHYTHRKVYSRFNANACANEAFSFHANLLQDLARRRVACLGQHQPLDRSARTVQGASCVLVLRPETPLQGGG